MADDRRPPHSLQAPEQESGEADLDAACTAAHRAFMAHVSACYACRRRGIDCYDVGGLKVRLRETQSAGIAARATTGDTIAAGNAAATQAAS
ncbi:hypothetical protein ACFT9I_13635 [Streptomyces sp. NPDC057137]|uniref:hypothetical protein n=1 Tax=Streptomyces sp. NPDC057137 TaxID=3346030 RepID=UPI003645A206